MFVLEMVQLLNNQVIN